MAGLPGKHQTPVTQTRLGAAGAAARQHPPASMTAGRDVGAGGARRTVEPTQAESQHAVTQRERGARNVLTVPNLISFARLLGVPLFLYLFLFLGSEARGWAV